MVSRVSFFVFFFKQKTAYEMRISDWSSDVCSSDLRTELIVRGASGIVASGLSTLALFYIMQAMPTAARLGGMILGVGVSQVATPLARVISPVLLVHGNIQSLFIFELGLTLMCLGSVALLRRSEEHTSELQSLMRISY